MLFCGRKLTAQEACSRGLVSQVFWPATFNQEVMIRVREMALCSSVVGTQPTRELIISLYLISAGIMKVTLSHSDPQVLEESKCLVRGILRPVLEEVNEKECQMLRQLWCSTKGLEALFGYMQNKA